MKTVNVHKAKTELSKLLTEVEAGEEVVIARNGKPAAKLVAIEPPKRAPKPRVPGALAHMRGNMPDDLFLKPLPDEELRAWEGGGFSEDGPQHGFDTGDLAKKVDEGVEFTLLRDGEPVGVVRPITAGSPEAMGYGMLRHLKGKIPPDLFLEPMSEEELALWEKGDLP